MPLLISINNLVVVENVLIAPSILSANFLQLKSEIEAVASGGANLLHCDVMDGHFVPNLTFGPFILSQISKASTVPLDVHLMIQTPEKWVRSYIDAGASWLTIHFESTMNCDKTLQEIKNLGAKPGLSLKPGTPSSAILDHLEFCHHVLVMTVEPGFGGQKFRQDCVTKVKEISQAIKKRGLSTLIEVDGGITQETIGMAYAAGAQVFVAGTEIFKAPDYKSKISQLRDRCLKGNQ